MNTGQTLVVILVTAIILIMIAVGFRSFGDIFSEATLYPTLFLGMASGILLNFWFLVIFISDLYANIQKVNDKCEQMQKQTHSDIMKKYTENTESCQNK